MTGDARTALPGLWGAFFAAGLGAVYAGFALFEPGDGTVLIVTVAIGVVLIVLERLVPQQRDWCEPDGQGWHDVGHFLFGFGLGTFGGTLLAQWMFAAPWWAIWPSTWPLLVQIVIGLIVSEAIIYWQHRAVHTELLWPLHALHHSTQRMTFFKTTRIHALDIGSVSFLSTATLLIVGAPASVVLWVTAFGNFAAQTQHANVALPTPSWLNAIVGTPATHWLHHSIDRREGNSNFGMNLMLFDHLFGTYIPPKREPHVALGIHDDFVPRTFLGQLTLPWLIVRRMRRGASTDTSPQQEG
jgi:ornithine lipid hydroxylase